MAGSTLVCRWCCGPLCHCCGHCHTLPQPMACRTNPTIGIRVHWSGACGPHLHRLLYPVDTTHPRCQSSGDVMVISNVAGLPLSLPVLRMSAGVVWSLVMPRPFSTLTVHHVGMTTEVNDHIPHAVRAYGHIFLMPAGHGMVTKRIKSSDWTQLATTTSHKSAAGSGVYKPPI